MKRIILLVSVALLMTVFAGVATAAPAAQSPVGGTFAHPHHVHTPNGCVDINSVLFEPAHRGLHEGAHASGEDRGPWHGACYQSHPHYPGQP